MSKFGKRGVYGGVTALLLALGLALGSAGIARAADQPAEEDNLYESLAIFSDILQKVRTEYVEPVNSQELIFDGIDGMLRALDPFTQYLDADQYRYLMQGTQGEFGGLGIEIAVRDGQLTVISPIEGTPAYRMGIQGGDRIIKIEGESTEGITSEAAVKKLRGPRGTQVTITIQREGVPQPLDYTITRDIIKIESVPYAFMLPGQVGLVRVSNFAEDTAVELDRHLKELEAQHPKGIILDLRYNPGGLLAQAVEVSNLFVDRDRIIVSTRGRRAAQNREYLARGPATHGKVPLIVLVNGASASASEIVAGAIQDWDLGLIVGTRTFGKGSVQSVVPLKHGGGALKITTAKYFTPSGRCIHRDENSEEARLAAAEEAEAEGRSPEPATLRPASESPDSAKVFHTSKGRVVRGGWGVAPDVEIEQARRTELATDLERRTLFFKFMVKWLAAHPEVTATTSVADAPLGEFLTFLKDEKVEITPDQLKENRDYIVRALRREMALKLEGHQAAVQVAVEGDVQLLDAAKLFDEAARFTDRSPTDALFAAAQQRAQAARAGEQAHAAEAATVRN